MKCLHEDRDYIGGVKWRCQHCGRITHEGKPKDMSDVCVKCGLLKAHWNTHSDDSNCKHKLESERVKEIP